MKLIIPLAGAGTRLRPHTWSKPKPLVHVAGKPVLGHLIDQYKHLDLEEIVFITGDMDEQIKSYVSKSYPQYKTTYIPQKELNGDAHALYLAKDSMNGEVIINFNDTLFETDLSLMDRIKSKAEGIIWVKETQDPKRFGIITENEGYITNLEEKPENPKSNLAVIGLYYFKNSNMLFDYLERIIKENKSTKDGELRLADALAVMIEDKLNLCALKVSTWLDTGKKETLLETNRHLLDNGCAHENGYGKNNIIIPPVFIEKGADVRFSTIGPYVSISTGAKIYRSSIEDSIIGPGAELSYEPLIGSLVGTNTQSTRRPRRLNLGDNSELIED